MKKEIRTDLPSALRKRAEALLQGQEVSFTGLSSEEARLLTQELQVHQIELEMQNEELQRAHRELEEAHDRIVDLYDFAPVAYVTADGEGRIVEANLTAANLLGVERSNLVGQHFGRFIAHDDKDGYHLHRRQTINTGIHCICELTLVKHDGNTFVAKLESAVAQAGDGEFTRCRTVISDVTEHRRLEAELLESRNRQSTLVLTDGIAHDFNNLLAAVMGYCSLAQHQTGLPKRAADYLAEADKGLAAMRDLIRQLMNLAAPVAAEKGVVSILEILEQSSRLALAGSEVHCRHALADDLWAVVANASLISRVLHNLLLNAKEAVREDTSLQIAARNVVALPNDVSGLREGRYVRISVIDRGIGIDPTHLLRIFDPYFSTKPRGAQKGQGLGLAVARSIVVDHGGTITVDSEVGIGTAVHVYLPAAPDEVAKASDDETPSLPPGGGHILVMDDQNLVRGGLCAMLEHLGYTVEAAGDGNEAIAMYRAAMDSGRRFDAAILDLTVQHGMNGEQTNRELLALDPQATTIVSSGFINDPRMTEYACHGFAAKIPKPYRLQELHKVLHEVLHRA